MALEGDLTVFRLPDILQMVAQQQKTGILTVQGEHDILAVSFLHGEIVAADALNQNFEEGLGEVLASQGVVRPEDFARVSEGHRSSGQRLADYLVDRGVISRFQLLSALRQQTYRLLLQVLRWSEGEFKFYSGEEVSFEEGVTPISVEELLMRSIGDLMGEGTLSGTLPHGFVAYERLPTSRVTRLLGRDGDLPGEDPNEVWLSADEERILDRLDGRTTASQVAESSGLGEYKTLYSLFRLLQAGLVRPRSAQESIGPHAPAVSAVPVAPAVPGAAGASGLPVSPALDAEKPPAPERKGKPERKALRSAPAEEIALPEESPASAQGALVGRLLGVGCLAALVGMFILAYSQSTRLLFPYPWMRSDRATFERQERLAQALLIDRAARTHFLLEGAYPIRLEELVARQMIPASALSISSGEVLGYKAEALSYTLQLPGQASSGGVPALTETISGDFAVDPDFFRGLKEEEGIPLVLLD